MEQVEVKYDAATRRYHCGECKGSFYNREYAQICCDSHVNIQFLESLPVGSVVYTALSNSMYDMYRIVRLNDDKVKVYKPGQVKTTSGTLTIKHLTWHHPWLKGWLETNTKKSEEQWKAKHKQSIERKIKTAQTKLNQLNKALEAFD